MMDFSFEIRTELGREAVVRILDENVIKPGPVPTDGTFKGKVSTSEFFIMEDSFWPFIPKFSGSFEDSDTGTILRIEAYNGSVKLNVVSGWFASVFALVGSLQPLLNHQYMKVLGCVLGSVVFGAMAILFRRLYDWKLRHGLQILDSLFHGEIKATHQSGGHFKDVAS